SPQKKKHPMSVDRFRRLFRQPTQAWLTLGALLGLIGPVACQGNSNSTSDGVDPVPPSMSAPTIVAISASGLLAFLVVVLFLIVRYQRRQFSRAAAAGPSSEVAAIGGDAAASSTSLARRPSLRRYNNDPNNIPSGELVQFFGTDEAALQ